MENYAYVVGMTHTIPTGVENTTNRRKAKCFKGCKNFYQKSSVENP